MEDFEQDNVIQWIFEKIFDQLTLGGNELFVLPFSIIKKKTFDSEKIYEMINKLTGRSLVGIEKYISNLVFQEKFLFARMKKKIYVQILLHNIHKIEHLLDCGYEADSMAIQLAVINNHLEILKKIEYGKFTNDLLSFCAEYSYEQMYFYLREKGLVPNISVYNKAAIGNSLSILHDVNTQIGISSKILTAAFQTNNNDIILFLLQEATNENIHISPNLVTYPILNSNFEILDQLEKMGLIKWHNELYFSALLSGSMEMVKYLESKLPNIHENYILDTSKTDKKGRSSLLLEDIIYEVGGKKYFSHTMNYAIQSLSIEIVKYIYNLGYGLTISNIITAIKQAPPKILKFLAGRYNKKLPPYLVYYFGTNSFINDKMEKAKILIGYGLFNTTKKKVSDFKKESTHLQMITESVKITETGEIDPDYTMKYNLFFVPIKGFKMNYYLLAKTRICLEINIEEELNKIFSNHMNDVDNQFVIDTLFLFGNIEQIKKYCPMFVHITPPSKQILMEIICYCQINKLCYLVHNKLLDSATIHFLRPMVVMLSDPYINILFDKLSTNPEESYIKFLLHSGKKKLIQKWIDENQNYVINKKLAKILFLMDDLDLAKKFNLGAVASDDMIDWAKENDLLEIASHLKNIQKFN